MLKQYVAPPPDRKGVRGVWVYGPSGSGKSFTVRATLPDACLKDTGKFWPPSDSYDTVLIEDADPGS